jgi:hypothetical protein
MISRLPRLPLITLAALGLAAAPGAYSATASPWCSGAPALAVSQKSAGADLAVTLQHLLSAIWPDAGCVGDPSGGSCGAGPAHRSTAGRFHPTEGCVGDPSGSHCGSTSRHWAPRSKSGAPAS